MHLEDFSGGIRRLDLVNLIRVTVGLIEWSLTILLLNVIIVDVIMTIAIFMPHIHAVTTSEAVSIAVAISEAVGILGWLRLNKVIFIFIIFKVDVGGRETSILLRRLWLGDPTSLGLVECRLARCLLWSTKFLRII